MKLSDYAKQQGVRYETAWRWFRDGKIAGHWVGKHTILVDVEKPEALSQPQRVAVYARVSSAENKPDLDSQAERLVAYCSAKGYQVEKVVKEIGSGVNDAHPKLLHLLEDRSTTVIVDKERAGAMRVGAGLAPALSSLVSRLIASALSFKDERAGASPAPALIASALSFKDERAGASPAPALIAPTLSSLVSSPPPSRLAPALSSSLLYSFCARMYGLRRAKRTTEKIVQELEAHDATG